MSEVNKRRVVLIGCSKKKHPYVPDRKRGGRVLPSELYSSQLFKARVWYAESRGLPWMVLSAAFGVWESHVERNPVQLTSMGVKGPSDGNSYGESYDLKLSDLNSGDRAVWHIGTAYTLIHELWEPGGTLEPRRPKDLIFEIHAGKDYAHPLAEILQLAGVTVEIPMQGMGIFEQNKWYADFRR